MIVAIAEDEKKYADQLMGYLTQFSEETGISVEYRYFSSGMDLLSSEEQFDLLLLDIEMPQIDGMTLARRIREKDQDVLIMFVTYTAQFAVAGYEVSALGYILKPVNYHMFAMKMRRAAEIIASRAQQCIVVVNKNTTNKLALSDIIYAEVLGHMITYHLKNETISSTGSRTISSLEKEFESYGLIRCSQSYLVNLRYVENVQQDSLTLTNGEVLRISRTRKKQFMQALLQYWGK